MSKSPPGLLCPSSTINEPHAQLIGVVQADGRVAFAEAPIELTPEFVRVAKLGRDPDKRFRFTSACVQSGCLQWREGRCALGDDVLTAFTPETPAAAAVQPADEATSATEVASGPELAPCPIRARCRWFYQLGPAACAVCPEVIANVFYEDAAPQTLTPQP